jgi:hypothetical protein
MQRIRVLAVVMLLALAVGSVFGAAPETPRPAWPAYGLSILLGFGTGQYYLGENGTGFLIADAGGIACMVGGYVYMLSAVGALALNPSASLDTLYIGYGIVGVGAAVWAVSRIWEIVDIFGTAERLRQEGKVASLQPVLDVRPDAVAFEVSYSY